MEDAEEWLPVREVLAQLRGFVSSPEDYLLSRGALGLVRARASITINADRAEPWHGDNAEVTRTLWEAIAHLLDKPPAWELGAFDVTKITHFGQTEASIRRLEIASSSANQLVSALSSDGLSARLPDPVPQELGRLLADDEAPEEDERTGDPGRPELGASLYMAEFQRRVLGGLVEVKLVDEAQALLAWFRAAHPTRQPPTVGTIENRIRTPHRQHRDGPTK